MEYRNLIEKVFDRLGLSDEEREIHLILLATDILASASRPVVGSQDVS